MQVEWDSYKLGDLVQITTELVIRKDGFTFDKSDADADGKVPKDWLIGGDILPEGSLCSFVGPSETDEYAVVRKDLVGRALVIRFAHLSLVSPIDQAIEVESSYED